jgi:DNA polymerase III delta prime subunit
MPPMSNTGNDGQGAAAAAAAGNEDEEMIMEVDDDDDDEVPSTTKRRKTPNKVLYDLFTREGVVKAEDSAGRQYVHCLACMEQGRALAVANEGLPPAKRKVMQIVVPIKRIKRDCENHVRSCPYVKLEVKSQLELASKPLRKPTPASLRSNFGAASPVAKATAPVSASKSFCTAGPCEPQRHYYLANRSGTETILQQINQGSYCYVYGPPQTGKTTTCLQLAQELNNGGTYCAVRLSVASAKWYDKADEAWEAVLESWDRDINSQLPTDMRPTPGRNMRYYTDGFREPIPEAISRWAHFCPRPLVLFIDDMQALANNGTSSGNSPMYHSFLTQLLSGFHDRPKNFAHSICFVGEAHRLPSHFNIVSESIRLPNFSHPQVWTILEQMEVDSSHHFMEDAKARVATLTEGQPWILNAFGMILMNKIVLHHSMTFTVEHVDTVLALLIERMDPFLRRIVDIASDGTYGPILKALATALGSCTHDSKMEYLQEQGILSWDRTNGKYLLTCRALYSELIDKAPGL